MTRRGTVVAGIGFRRGTRPEAIVALVRRALAETAREGALAALATAADRAAEPALRDAAAAFGIGVRGISADALAAVDARVVTRSPRVLELRQIGSLAEAAALAAAGPGGRLVLARIASPGATCALAEIAAGEPEARTAPDHRQIGILLQ